MEPSKGSAIVAADTIRKLYRSDPEGAENVIECRIEEYCDGMTDSEKISFINDLLEKFEAPHENTGSVWPGTKREVLEDVFRLLLGRNISADMASSQEILDRLSSAMHTLFGTLNRIVKTINATLLENTAGEQTIRHVIGYEMECREGKESLEDFLGRIEKAFLVSHRAFKQAAHTIVRKLIDEIRPERFADDAGRGLKIGPMRRAEYFEIYREKHAMLQNWFESGRFMNDLLREFENNCQGSI